MQVARDQSFLDSWNRTFAPSRPGRWRGSRRQSHPAPPRPDPARTERPAERWRGDEHRPVRPATADRDCARRGQRRHPGGLPPAVPGLVVPRQAAALVLVSHLIAALLRRRRTPVALAALVSAVAGAGGELAVLRLHHPPGHSRCDDVRRLHRRPVRVAVDLFRTSRLRPRHCRASSRAPPSRQDHRVPGRLGGVPAVGSVRVALLRGPVRVRLAVRRRPVPGWCGGAVPGGVLVFLLLHRAWRLESSAAWIRGDAQRQPGAARAGVAASGHCWYWASPPSAAAGRARRSHHGLEGPRRR